MRVIAPMIAHKRRVLSVGDKVRYIGSDPNLKRQYEGVLEVVTACPFNGYTCLTPKERWSSWIERDNLQLAEVV